MSTPTGSPGDTGAVDIAPAMYGATGASLETFRRKYGPVQHTPLRMTHSVSVGPDSFVTPAPVKRTQTTGTQFDLWNAGGNDFPSPVKVPKIRESSPAKPMYALSPAFEADGVCRSKSVSTPAFAQPASRGPTFVNNSPIKFGGRKRHSGGSEGDDGIPGVRKW
jgi:hypothetical protein